MNKTPTSKLAYKIAVFLYIDDTNLVAINRGNKSEVEVIARAQLILDY